MMSWYRTRTDDELVALVARGDEQARAWLVDRSLLQASRVARYLEPDRDTAVAALVAAYSETFRDLRTLDDGGRFLPALLMRLDKHAPFPLDPATHAPLDPLDRERVRDAVLGAATAVAGRRLALPLVALLVLVAAVGIGVTFNDDGRQVAVTGSPTDGPTGETIGFGDDRDAAPDPVATEAAPDPVATDAAPDDAGTDAAPDDSATDGAVPDGAPADDGTDGAPGDDATDQVPDDAGDGTEGAGVETLAETL